MTSVELLEWRRLGRELRAIAMESCGTLQPLLHAWTFLREFPEVFGYAEWPEDMPAEAPLELIEAYFDRDDHGEQGL